MNSDRDHLASHQASLFIERDSTRLLSYKELLSNPPRPGKPSASRALVRRASCASPAEEVGGKNACKVLLLFLRIEGREERK